MFCFFMLFQELKDRRDDMLLHQLAWTGDRQFALDMRRACYRAGSDTIYECDDKCGSFWQALPVPEGGRLSKTAASKLYRFAIQSNTICGEGGVLRFAVVPKNVSTGSNFGLTNLLLVLHRARENGRISPTTRKLVRHTDGGPDNLSHRTHALHWLLVYLGVFDEILWFRFESGHSHTEIADRFFALMKKIFETDSNTRTSEPCSSFAELESRFREMFAKFPEELKFEFNFANWDFKHWFDGMGLSEGEFGRFTFDMVFNYEYVGPALASHGGVRVTCKKRLSDVGSAAEAEWLPIFQTTNADGDKVNRTEPEGIRFLVRPPDLRSEPRSEAFTDTKEDKGSTMARSALKFPGISRGSADEWAALAQLHEGAPHSGALPLLPSKSFFTSPPNGSDPGKGLYRDFVGSPMELKPILLALIRFPRPLITWNIFDEAAPDTFPSLGHDDALPGGDPNRPAMDPAPKPLRNPVEENRVVHEGYTQAAYNKNMKNMSDAEWVDAAPDRVEDEHWAGCPEGGGLYVVRLEVADGQFFFGVGRDLGPVDESNRNLQWFGRTSKTHQWPMPAKFTPWSVNEVDNESFLMKLDEDPEEGDVCASSKENAPFLTSAVLTRLKLFAERHNLLNNAPMQNAGKAAAPASGAKAKTTAKPAAPASGEQATSAAKPAAPASGEQATSATKPAAKRPRSTAGARSSSKPAAPASGAKAKTTAKPAAPASGEQATSATKPAAKRARSTA